MVNAEALLVKAMNDAGTLRAEGLEASMDTPSPRPEAFVTVEQTGGPAERYRSIPVIAVQVWGASRYEASRLAGVVSAWIRDELPLDPRIGRAVVSSVYNFPDPESNHPRYQLTVELVTQSI